jgi:hypothetical protein
MNTVLWRRAMGLVTTSRPGSANGRIAADHKTRRNDNPQKTNAQRQSQSRIPVTAMLSSYRVHYGLLQEIPWRGSRRSLGPRSLRNAMRHHANGCYPTDVTENGGTAGTLIFRTTSAATTQIFIPMGGQRPGYRPVGKHSHRCPRPAQRCNACYAMLRKSEESVLCHRCRALARPRSASVFPRPDGQRPAASICSPILRHSRRPSPNHRRSAAIRWIATRRKSQPNDFKG